MERDELLPYDALTDKFFNVGNYLVIAAFLTLSTSIGIYFWWRGHKDNDDYLLGGRSMSAFPVAMSLSTSFFSAVTMVSVPGDVYSKGTMYILAAVSAILYVSIASTFYMPVFVRLRLNSVYEYLELRFHSKALRSIASIYFVLVMLLYISVVIYAPSSAIADFAGINKYGSCAVLSLVCGVYTCLGGLKAVMWTDALQFFVMLGSYLAVIWIGTAKVGGVGTVFDRNYHNDRVQLFNFNTDMRDEFTVWSLVIGGTFNGIHTFGVCQTQVQRYLACKCEKTAARALRWNLVAMISLLMLCVYMGMLVFAFYHDCDPLQYIPGFYRPDKVTPLFVLQTMGDYPCVPGLLVAGLLSGALSTVSSGLNALASVFIQDGLYSFGYMVNDTTNRQMVVTRVLAVFFCVVMYALTFVLDNFPSMLIAALFIVGLITGPLLGAFTLGMFVPFANYRGTLTGVITGMVLALWMFVGAQVAYMSGVSGCSYPPTKLRTSIEQCPTSLGSKTNGGRHIPTVCPSWHIPLYDLSYFWPPAIVTLWVIVVGAMVSLCTKPQDPTKLPAEYISPAVNLLFCWWPSFLRKPLEEYFALVGSAVEKTPSKKECIDGESTDATVI